MGRPLRDLQTGYCYHLTVRCNAREFRLATTACREIVLFALHKAQEKFHFKLFALCIMANHVHYLLEPGLPEDLPRIMHWLNWYTAMCLNRLHKRTGHFWEKRYHSSGFPLTDMQRALNTLRYIHANPSAAGERGGFIQEFSNFGAYMKPEQDDGLTQWHPAFFALAEDLDGCVAAYRDFCQRYQPRDKTVRRCSWGERLLEGIVLRRGRTQPGQKLLFDNASRCQVTNPAIQATADQFRRVNGSRAARN